MKGIVAAFQCLLLVTNFLSTREPVEEREPYNIGDFAYVLQEDDTAEIIAYHGEAEELVIPDEVDKHSVTAIGDEAFSECEDLKRVVIPESVMILGYRAFDNGNDVTIVIEGEREYIDKVLRCKECGKNFTFSAEEQKFYADRGFLKEPTTCGDCRNGSGNNTTSSGRKFYTTNCGRCGKEIQVPYKPNPDRPSYCSDCFKMFMH